jgi:hypothetical protein
MGAITRSEGYELTVGAAPVAVAGGGYSGCTAELDAVVAEAAQALAAAYGQDVEIRFNSDRESGGAWLKTAAGRSNQVGIAASLVTARHRAQVEASAQEAEAQATTGRASWQREPMTSRQREGARACAAYDRAWLAQNPEGQLTVFAHLLRAAVCGGELRHELEQLPGWNAMEHTAHQAYHHGEAASVVGALARCLRFVPPGHALAGSGGHQ